MAVGALGGAELHRLAEQAGRVIPEWGSAGGQVMQVTQTGDSLRITVTVLVLEFLLVVVLAGIKKVQGVLGPV